MGIGFTSPIVPLTVDFPELDVDEWLDDDDESAGGLLT